jgi:hypothetical protein
VGFVVDKVALRQVSSEYFGFPYQFSFHLLLHTHHHHHHHHLSSGAGKMGETVAHVPSGLISPHEKKFCCRTQGFNTANTKARH